MNRVLVLAVLLASASCTIVPVPYTATIYGVIYTADGAPLPGVIVTVTGPPGQPTFMTVTDEEGKYSVSGIIPGMYEVTSELQGFETARQRVQVTNGTEEPVVTKLRFAPLGALFSST